MYTLTPITDDATWDATYDIWMKEAFDLGDEGMFLATEFSQRLEHQRELVKKTKDLHSYFLVSDGDAAGCASSIIEVSHAMQHTEASWLKLLGITLRPSLMPINCAGVDKDKLKQAIMVLASSVIKSVELIYDKHPAGMLKIYGRTTEMRELFTGIISSGEIDDSLEKVGLSAKIQGKWLVLEKKQKG